LRVAELHYTTGLGGNRSFLPTSLPEFYAGLTKNRGQFRRPSTVGDNLYLTRTHEKRRRLVNEHEIERLLENRGFTIINPSDFDYNTQIGIFQRAKTIVAPHGAALTNLLYCPDGVRVIEFFPDCYIHLGLQRIANLKKARYAYIIGTSVRGLHSTDDHDFTYSISEKELEIMIDAET
jgi:capsular polysaccharide biosynthesis protein